MIPEIAALVVVLYAAWGFIAMESNYRRASSMGIPLIRLPIDPLNVLFQVFEAHVWTILDLLPIRLPTFARYARRGWFFPDKAESHLKYGPIWALVTPRDIHINICDPQSVVDIFAKRTQFVRPSKMYKLLEVYGPCISTADETDWPRHRKILSAPFNENAMDFTWNEARRQATQMLDSWIEQSESKDGLTSVAKNTRAVSLNIMAASGFHRSFQFKSSTRESEGPVNGEFSYRDALQIVLDNAILLMLISPRMLLGWWLPTSLRRVGQAAADFKTHMTRMMEKDLQALQEGQPGSQSLMTSFVRSLNTGPKGFTVDEIFGNTFVINFAGHDTTANTLTFSLLLLARHPEIQDWLREEVVTVANDDSNWEYQTLFPKLVRCRAILLETLRLYPPIMSLPKWTNNEPQALRVASRTIIIPPNTGISPSVLATHTHPDYWPDPLIWKPSRWILANEGLLVPQKGTYFPWSEGPHNCLGMKFSQVEFVAVIATLMKGCSLSVIGEEGESEKDMQTRVDGVINDCDMQLLLRMKNPDKVRVKCTPSQ
ncbi:putative cytochrome P450 monooxygenase [Lophiotrema nucula]|uniref:Putative cytochrome P450 monooxygenase n=1 Tax=Lophiotrema nucula TaxID=690887 RepID=A0A6A5YFU7_9PLEO|nr:putative cytochrome P450 monooxygenase [Lophiotrema nucula]